MFLAMVGLGSSTALAAPTSPTVVDVSLSFSAPASKAAGEAFDVTVTITPAATHCFETVGIYIDISPDTAILGKTVLNGFTILTGSEESTSSAYGVTLYAPSTQIAAVDVLKFTITSNTAGTLSGITVNGSGVNKSAAYCGGDIGYLAGVNFSTTITGNTVSGKVVEDLVEPYGQEDVGDLALAGATIEFFERPSGTSVDSATTGANGLYSIVLPNIATYDYVVTFPTNDPPYLPTTGVGTNTGSVTMITGGVSGLNFYAKSTTKATAEFGNLTANLEATGETATVHFEPVTGPALSMDHTLGPDHVVVQELPNVPALKVMILQEGRANVYGPTYAGANPSAIYDLGFVQPCVSTDPINRNFTQLTDAVSIIGHYGQDNPLYNPVDTAYSPLVDAADVSAALSNYFTVCIGSHPNPNAIIGGGRAAVMEYGPENPAATVTYRISNPVVLRRIATETPTGIQYTNVVDITVMVYADTAPGVWIAGVALNNIIDVPQDPITGEPGGGTIKIELYPPEGMYAAWNEAFKTVMLRVGENIQAALLDRPGVGTPLDLYTMDDLLIAKYHYVGTQCPQFLPVTAENTDRHTAITTVADGGSDLYTKVVVDWGTCPSQEPPQPNRSYLPLLNRTRSR